MESRVSDIEDKLPPVVKEAHVSHQLAKDTNNRADDMENRLRCNNILIVGLPEKTEGKDPTSFIEGWLSDLFGKDAFSPFFTVERAHCTPGCPLPPGAPPRPVLARLLHYRDREAVLRCAREWANVQFKGTRVSFYPDFSAEVQRRRAKFADVKRQLRNLQLPYVMLFPAKLHVTANRQAHFFESAQEATTWLDWNEQALRHRRE